MVEDVQLQTKRYGQQLSGMSFSSCAIHGPADKDDPGIAGTKGVDLLHRALETVFNGLSAHDGGNVSATARRNSSAFTEWER